MNPIRYHALLIVTLSIWIGGCTSFWPYSRTSVIKDGVAVVDSDVTRRSVFLLTNPRDGKSIIIAAEPPPDAAMQTAAQLTARLNYQGITGEASGQLTQSIVELGKRSEAVMVLREGLYRIEQMTCNGQLNPADAKSLIDQVLQAATQIATATQHEAAAELQRATAQVEAQRTKQKILDVMPDQERQKLTVQRLHEILGQ